mmetsp:Transcript_8276/g.20215  ORF Transcript_8276/g.20215 Transcript_8276/m.20215 type:complete len:115 (-) Transcript_8276:519-863(-)
MSLAGFGPYEALGFIFVCVIGTLLGLAACTAVAVYLIRAHERHPKGRRVRGVLGIAVDDSPVVSVCVQSAYRPGAHARGSAADPAAAGQRIGDNGAGVGSLTNSRGSVRNSDSQ